MKTKGWIKAIACGLCVSMLFQSAAFAAENNGISDKTVLESSETVTDETFSESLESANSETETKETDAEVSETETEAVRETKDTSETDQIQMNQETKAPETATAESEDIKSQNNEDTYTVSVKLDEENEKIIAELKYSGDTSAIENIAFPTWTEENGQDDIIWEVASQVDSSTWRAEILLKNYDYAKGIYNVHAYAYFKDGTYECAGTEALDVQVDPKGILKISVNNHAQIEAVLSNVKNADEVDHVAFPVWTEKNGQDDIVWHIADKNSDGTYSAVIDSANHNNESGLYNVHAYTYDKSDNATFIDGTSCTVERITAATGIQLLDQDAASGKFRAQIINVQSSSEITGVRFGVWTDKNGQDDIRWYNASHSGNVWYADISAENHNYESGTYHLVCYAADANGTDQLLSAADKVLNVSDPGEMTVKVDSKQSKITVTLTGTNFGKDVTRVAFAVWTEANGQDDIAELDVVLLGEAVEPIQEVLHRVVGGLGAHDLGQAVDENMGNVIVAGIQAADESLQEVIAAHIVVAGLNQTDFIVNIIRQLGPALNADDIAVLAVDSGINELDHLLGLAGALDAHDHSHHSYHSLLCTPGRTPGLVHLCYHFYWGIATDLLKFTKNSQPAPGLLSTQPGLPTEPRFCGDPKDFICSGGMNPPGIKVLPKAKRLVWRPYNLASSSAFLSS